MQLKDPETATFGAEALPGGLREINAVRGGKVKSRAQGADGAFTVTEIAPAK